MRRLLCLAAAAGLFLFGDASAAALDLPGRTWLSSSCPMTFMFGADGTFGEYDDLGENHFGEWEVEDGALYLVFQDESYLKGEMTADSFEVAYAREQGATEDCVFSASL